MKGVSRWLAVLVEAALVGFLVACGASVRVALADLPNFAPVAALALFAGIWLRRAWAACLVPAGVMMVSDLWLGRGFYELPLLLLVYGSLMAPVACGRLLRASRLRAARSWKTAARFGAACLAAALGGAVLFFAVTNLGCWWLWYDRSWGGWVSCYANAIPFFRFTLAGDLSFAGGLLAGHLAWGRLVIWLQARSATTTPAARPRFDAQSE